MIQEVMYTEEDIRNRISDLAEEIEKFYNNKNLVVVPLLRGGFVFASDLIRRINLKLEVDFLTTSSYGNETISSGNVSILGNLRSDIKDKHVLIVDDIIDTGNTLVEVKKHLSSFGPKDIKICTMLDKPSRRKQNINADFVGFTIDDVFIVGYGLDYENYYRNTPYIFRFIEE